VRQKEKKVMNGDVKRISSLVFSTMLLPCFVFVHAQTEDDSKALQLQPREAFKNVLPKITVSVDYITKDFNGVRISFPESNDQVLIGVGDDMYIKNSSRGSDKTLYSEAPEKASFLTKFETKYIGIVNKSFIKTLEDFDRILQRKEWAKCRYLDGFLPNFLKGYYYFIGATRNSSCALPRSARVPEEEYDVSQNSPKTDWRIRDWELRPEYVIKLRIAAQELAHQLDLWQKLLEKERMNEDIVTPKEMEETLIIFVRIYFNLKPPSPIIAKKYRD
jgi:hypothetical protein